MDYKPLSENQRKVLEAILSRANNDGFSASSIREIQNITGIGSVRGVTLQFDTLEQQGFIHRIPGKMGIYVEKTLLKQEEKISIPLMTSIIPAGYGSPADAFSDQTIDVSVSDTKGVRSAFAVPVSGESMIGAGIEDGDVAIIAPQQVANDGDIVAAFYDSGVTLKRYRVVDGIPMLMPANPKFRPIVESFQIQGKLINLIKK